MTDIAGFVPIRNTNSAMTDTGETSDYLKKRHEFYDYSQANGIKLYYSADQAAEGWAKENRPLSEEKERMSFIYEHCGYYFYSKPIEGTSSDTVFATIFREIVRYIGDYDVYAQIHSHPKDEKGKHSDFPSMDKDITGGDRIAMKLFGYKEMYVVSYERCDGTNTIIKITDPSTWCADHPYR